MITFQTTFAIALHELQVNGAIRRIFDETTVKFEIDQSRAIAAIVELYNKIAVGARFSHEFLLPIVEVSDPYPSTDARYSEITTKPSIGARSEARDEPSSDNINLPAAAPFQRDLIQASDPAVVQADPLAGIQQSSNPRLSSSSWNASPFTRFIAVSGQIGLKFLARKLSMDFSEIVASLRPTLSASSKSSIVQLSTINRQSFAAEFRKCS